MLSKIEDGYYLIVMVVVLIGIIYTIADLLTGKGL